MKVLLVALLAVLASGCGGHRALDLARRADRRLPGDRARLRTLHEQALDLLAAGDIGASHRLALRCLESDPGFAAAHRLLGDLYELEGDAALAMIEHLAFADLARGSDTVPLAWQDYRQAKILGGDLAGPDSRKDRAQVLYQVSQALAELRRGKQVPAEHLLAEATRALPGFALAQAAGGMVFWRLELRAEAVAALRRAARLNAHLAGLLLAGRLLELDAETRGLVARELARKSKISPGDGERLLLLAILSLEQNRPQEALRRLATARGWSEFDQRYLLVAAETHRRLGNRKRLEDSLERLVRAPTWSLLFLPRRAAWFMALAGQVLTPVVEQELLPRLVPGQRQYFAWSWYRWLSADSAARFRQELVSSVEGATRLSLPARRQCRTNSRDRPTGFRAYNSWFRATLERYRPLLASCDCSRQSRRPRRWGRLRLEFEVQASGRVGQVVVSGNDTADEMLAACHVAILQRLCFPPPLRAKEYLTLEITLGMEDDHERPCRGK